MYTRDPDISHMGYTVFAHGSLQAGSVKTENP